MADTGALVRALIETEALHVAPSEEVFWYTSGTVGPYYINTHFLYGGPQQASELLDFINESKSDIDRFPRMLSERVLATYDSEPSYRTAVDALVRRVDDLMKSESPLRFDCVSGGERRDWFFSVAVAAKMDKPHLYLYKDLSAVLTGSGGSELIEDLEGRSTLHVADLVTEASSYTKMWVPAIERRGGNMAHAINLVDRAQGGSEAIEALGVPATALIRVDEELFRMLREKGLIDSAQHRRLTAYFRDPHGAMREFLTTHPRFVEQSLDADDSRVAERAKLLIEEDLYGLRST